MRKLFKVWICDWFLWMKGFGENFLGVTKSAVWVFLNHLISLIYRLKVHMTRNFFRYGWKKYCLKYTISKFEMFWIKAEDFMSAWSWAILSQKNGIRIARSKYHVTLSVTSRWCHKHSMQFEHSIVLLLLSFLRDRNRLIPRYTCLLSRSTSLFSSETPQFQQLSRVSLWMWRHVGTKLGPVPWPFVTSKWPNFKRS